MQSPAVKLRLQLMITRKETRELAQRQLDIKMRKKIIVCEYCGRIMIDPELAGVKDVN
mgnify:FL=1